MTFDELDALWRKPDFTEDDWLLYEDEWNKFRNDPNNYDIARKEEDENRGRFENLHMMCTAIRLARSNGNNNND